jgi:hypothetical protein
MKHLTLATVGFERYAKTTRLLGRVPLLDLASLRSLERDRARQAAPFDVDRIYRACALRALKRFARKNQIHLIVTRKCCGATSRANIRSQASTTLPTARIGTTGPRLESWFGEVRTSAPSCGLLRRATATRSEARYHDEIGVPREVVVRYVREQSTFEAA